MKNFKTLFHKKYNALNTPTAKHIDDKTIFHVFKKVIMKEYGQSGAINIIPEYYRDHVIFLTFHRSIWAQEVWTNRQKLIDAVNEYLGEKILFQIKIKK